jgi:ribosomal RNA-processing protein 12
LSKDETWEEIFSDSDDEEKGDTKKSNKRGNGKQGSKDSKSWIMETDDATNLLDSSMAKNVVGTKPKQKNKLKKTEHFELSTEGKLIINEDDAEKIAEDTPLDIGEKNVLGGYVKAPRNVKLGKRKLAEDMPEEEKFAYKPGGAGIHRDRDNDDESGKAHRSGQEYKAKRAKGDIKLKGKPDPYAYVQFNKQKLNKRKKSKLENDFTGLIKGGKSRLKNKSKKQK